MKTYEMSTKSTLQHHFQLRNGISDCKKKVEDKYQEDIKKLIQDFELCFKQEKETVEKSQLQAKKAKLRRRQCATSENCWKLGKR